MLEEAASRKRKVDFHANLSQSSLDFLNQSVLQYQLTDISRALRAVLDYVIQETQGDTLFGNLNSGSQPIVEPQTEYSFILDVTHMDWLESHAKKFQFASLGALIDFVITQIKGLDGSLIFEIDRSKSRAKIGGITFSIKS